MRIPSLIEMVAILFGDNGHVKQERYHGDHRRSGEDRQGDFEGQRPGRQRPSKIGDCSLHHRLHYLKLQLGPPVWTSGTDDIVR